MVKSKSKQANLRLENMITLYQTYTPKSGTEFKPFECKEEVSYPDISEFFNKIKQSWVQLLKVNYGFLSKQLQYMFGLSGNLDKTESVNMNIIFANPSKRKVQPP